MKQSEAEPRKPREKFRPKRRLPKKQDVIQNTTELAEVANVEVGNQQNLIQEMLKDDFYDLEISRGSTVKSKILTTTTLREVLIQHVNGSMSAKIEKIRQEPDKKKRSKLKQLLLPFYSMATYKLNSEGKLIRSLATFESTGVVQVDVDDLPGGEKEIKECLSEVLGIPQVFLAFRSPSKNGLRGVIRVSEMITDPKTYAFVYKKIAAQIEKKTDLTLDASCSDASRAWYFSHDPEMVLRDAPRWDISGYLEEYKKLAKKGQKRKKQAQANAKKTEVQKLPQNLLEALLELKAVHLNRHEWYNKLGFALATFGGEEARGLFVDISYNEFYLDDTEEYLHEVYNDLLAAADPEKTSQRVLEKLLESKGIDILPEVKDDGSFWYDVVDGDGNKKTLKKSIHLFNHRTLLSLGFFYDATTGKIGRFLKGNLVKTDITRQDMKGAVHKFIVSFKHPKELDLLDWVANHSNLFLPANLEFLPKVKLNWLKDDKDYMYVKHKKGITRISRKTGENEIIGYDEIGDRYVNVDTVLDWDGVLASKEEADSSDYALFTARAMGEIPDHIDHFYRAAAYLCDSYKKRSEAVAVVFQDEHIEDEFTPQGGGGKSLIVEGIKIIAAPAIEIDGKLFKGGERFQNQNILPGHRLVVIDDIFRKISSEVFFIAISGDYKTESKGETAVIIPFLESPKLVFTANHYFVQDGNSNKRRYVIVGVSNHYNKDHSPRADFKKDLLSDEWTQKDWRQFYSFWILTIIPTYLEKGLSREMMSSALDMTRMRAETSLDFMVWAKTGLTQDVSRVDVNVLRDDCLEAVGKSTERILESSKNKFSIWMRKYVENVLGCTLKREQSSGKTLITIMGPEGEGGAENKDPNPSKPRPKRPLKRINRPAVKAITVDGVFDE